MRNRFLKHLIFGIFYLIIFSLIGWGIFSLVRPTPSCFDQKLNGTETAIDCGGSCISCQIKDSSGLKILDQKIIPSGDNLYTLYFQLANPLSDFGLNDFTYQIVGFDSVGNEILKQSNQSFIYPQENKYIIEPALKTKAPLAAVDIKINNTQWISKAEFKKPQIQYVNLQTQSQQNFISTSGTLINKESSPFFNTVVVALYFKSDGTLIGASRTIVEKLESFSQQDFYLSYPTINADLSQTQIFIYAPRPGVSGVLYEINPYSR